MDIETRFGLTVLRTSKRSFRRDSLFVLALAVGSFAIWLSIDWRAQQGMGQLEALLIALSLPGALAGFFLSMKRRQIVFDRVRHTIRIVDVRRFGPVARRRYRFDQVRRVCVQHGDSDFVSLQLIDGETVPVNVAGLPRETSDAIVETLRGLIESQPREHRTNVT